MTIHVDDFIDDYESDAYAAFVLNYFRSNATNYSRWAPWMKAHKLFCTWEGKRYRVTSASRLGDVWLSADFDCECGYDRRVDIDKCSEWGAAP